MPDLKLKYAPSMIEREILKLNLTQTKKEDFLKFLDKEKTRLEKIKETIQKEKEKANDTIRDTIKSEVDTGFMGIDTLLMAIDHLKKYEYDPRTIILDEGKKLAQRGQELLFKAAEMNQSSYDSMLDTIKTMADNPSGLMSQEEMMISPY